MCFSKTKVVEQVVSNPVLALHPAEQKLIEAVRSINFGEIDSIKIQNGLPVMFKVTLAEQDLYSERVLQKQ